MLVKGGIYNLGVDSENTVLYIVLDHRIDTVRLYTPGSYLNANVGKRSLIIYGMADLIKNNLIHVPHFHEVPSKGIEKDVFGYLGKIPEWMLDYLTEFAEKNKVFYP